MGAPLFIRVKES